MEQLYQLIASHEDWLMKRILEYAIKHHYAQYTSTLTEPWRLSICGLSGPILETLKSNRTNLELSPNEDYSRDPIAAFGILEAQRHRERGIDLGMFLGLFKYYRQSYIDLLNEADLEPRLKADYDNFLHRFFDRIEIGFCSEWSRINESTRFKELQAKNRVMTNEKNKYLTLFESLAKPVILLDHNNCIENINHSAANLFNVTSNRYYNISPADGPLDAVSTSIGQPISQVMPWIAAELDTFISQKPVYLECEKSVDTCDGLKYYQVKFSAMLDVSGKFNSVLIILNDQTEQKLAEERVRLALDAAESANRAKSEFLANMSHELRTPLNAILGFAQLMATSPDIPLDHQENLSIVTRSGQHLLNLINQVLDLSKIESGRMALNLRTFDLYALLDDLYSTFSLLAREKQLDLLFERADNVPQFITADDIKLRQVLINLLSNSLKFTRKGSICLRLTCQLPDSAHTGAASSPLKLAFEIEDTGVGIAPEELPTIFDVFVQTQSGRESQEGTGLGMAISQKFLQMMGGDITVTSQVGRGTQASFGIEAHLSAPSQRPPEINGQRRVVGLQPNQPKFKILVVDDTLDNRLLLEKLLVPVGFEVSQAANGQQAVEIWEKWQPHLTLMDIRMPVLNGFLATKRIKQLAGEQGAKIIAVSASVFDENKATTLNIGCDDFLRKPFKETKLFLMLEKHLGVRYNYESVSAATVTYARAQKLSAKQHQLIAQRLTSLPASWQLEFKEAVERIDLEVTQTLVNQLAEIDDSVATTLQSFVKNFRFDILQTLLKDPDLCNSNPIEAKSYW